MIVALRVHMPDTQGEQSANTAAWEAFALRLTAFPAAPLDIVETGWWSGLVGKDPESRHAKPKARELQEVGEFQSQRLILGVNALSISWRLTIPDIDNETVETTDVFPSMGRFSESLDFFLPLMHRFLDDYCPEIQRIAFGAELVTPAESRPDAYRQLGPLIPVALEPEGVSDFLYQINRRRPSRSDVPGLYMNRLTKWSAIQLTLGVSVSDQAYELPGLTFFGSRLELDMNTVPEFPGTLPTHRLSTIFDELVDLGKEIATHGDIP